MSQFFAAIDQRIGASASASVLPIYIQDLFPLKLTGLISLESKGLSWVSSNTTGGSINSLALSLLYTPTLTSISDYWKNHSFHYTELCQQQRKALFYRIFSSCLLALNLTVTRPAHTLYRTAYGKPFDVPLPRTLLLFWILLMYNTGIWAAYIQSICNHCNLPIQYSLAQ